MFEMLKSCRSRVDSAYLLGIDILYQHSRE